MNGLRYVVPNWAQAQMIMSRRRAGFVMDIGLDLTLSRHRDGDIYRISWFDDYSSESHRVIEYRPDGAIIVKGRPCRKLANRLCAVLQIPGDVRVRGEEWEFSTPHGSKRVAAWQPHTLVPGGD